MKINKAQWQWTREPKEYKIEDECIEIVTEPHTDLWQRTYYHFRNDNAPVLQIRTSEKYFSFTVKTEFASKHRFDQCGVVMYLDSENWLKGSIEYENESFQHLGSVATNMGYSDWATTEINADIKTMWYRFSRREDDYCIERINRCVSVICGRLRMKYSSAYMPAARRILRSKQCLPIWN